MRVGLTDKGKITMTSVNTHSQPTAVPIAPTPGGTSELDEARRALQKASENLGKQEGAKVAAEIREGVAFVEREASHAGADVKRALEGLALELNRLADDVDKGVATNAADLDSAFARAGAAVEDTLRASGRWTGEALGEATKAVGTWLTTPLGALTPGCSGK